MKRKPCEAPCPKCGSLDISRHHRIAGDTVATGLTENVGFDDAIKCADRPLANQYNNIVVRETISCYCRVCRFFFNVAPLRKRSIQNK